MGDQSDCQRQPKVESRNFEIPKQLLEYDDVAHHQRRAIDSQRNELLDVSDVSETINSIREDVFKATIDAYIPPQSLEEMWDIPGLQERLKNDSTSIYQLLSGWIKNPNCMKRRCVSAFWRSPSKCISVKKKWLVQR
ncbi:hypothetical protein ACNKHR_07515 [Shigella flexneri]